MLTNLYLDLFGQKYNEIVKYNYNLKWNTVYSCDVFNFVCVTHCKKKKNVGLT